MQLDQEIRSPKNSHGDESAADGQVDKAMGNKNGHGNDSNGDEQLNKTVTTIMAMGCPTEDHSCTTRKGANQ